MRLKLGLGIGAVIGGLLTGGYFLRAHRLRNYADIGFTRCSTVVSPSRDTGKSRLEIGIGEPFRVNYACEDKDKLREIILYDDSEILLKFPINNKCGHYATWFFRQPILGEHIYKVVAVDSKGNKREDTAKLTVKDIPYEVGPILGINIGWSFDR